MQLTKAARCAPFSFCSWLTQGPPDSWSAVLIQPRDAAYEVLEMGAARIVQEFVRGTLTSAILPKHEAAASCMKERS